MVGEGVFPGFQLSELPPTGESQRRTAERLHVHILTDTGENAKPAAKHGHLGKMVVGGGGGNDKTKTKPFAMNLKHHLLGFSSVIGVEVS